MRTTLCFADLLQVPVVHTLPSCENIRLLHRRRGSKSQRSADRGTGGALDRFEEGLDHWRYSRGAVFRVRNSTILLEK